MIRPKSKFVKGLPVFLSLLMTFMTLPDELLLIPLHINLYIPFCDLKSYKSTIIGLLLYVIFPHLLYSLPL
jgi:hypothetical protein